jgi:hypothetical protein
MKSTTYQQKISDPFTDVTTQYVVIYDKLNEAFFVNFLLSLFVRKSQIL